MMRIDDEVRRPHGEDVWGFEAIRPVSVGSLAKPRSAHGYVWCALMGESRIHHASGVSHALARSSTDARSEA